LKLRWRAQDDPQQGPHPGERRYHRKQRARVSAFPSVQWRPYGGINRRCAKGSGMVNGSLAQITDASPTRTIPECFRHTDGVRPARLRHGPFAGRSRSRVARRGGRICNSQTLIGMRERCESGQRSRFRDAEFVVNSIAFRCTPRGAGPLQTSAN
jgi:hypothetical protein